MTQRPAEIVLTGGPEPLEIERKFPLAAPPAAGVLCALGAQPIDIEQSYLATEDDRHVRIRRRGIGANAMYYRTEKIRRSDTTRVERESLDQSARIRTPQS